MSAFIFAVSEHHDQRFKCGIDMSEAVSSRDYGRCPLMQCEAIAHWMPTRRATLWLHIRQAVSRAGWCAQPCASPPTTPPLPLPTPKSVLVRTLTN